MQHLLQMLRDMLMTEKIRIRFEMIKTDLKPSVCSGQLCEVPSTPRSLCDLADCQNNAPCVERGGHALCQCLEGFGGPRCEKLVSVNFVDRDSYLLLSDLKNWPQANITLQVFNKTQTL